MPKIVVDVDAASAGILHFVAVYVAAAALLLRTREVVLSEHQQLKLI